MCGDDSITPHPVRQWGFTSDSLFLNSSEQLLHRDGRQVREEIALVVPASENQQSLVDRARLFTLLWETAVTGCLHGDDGVSRPGDWELRERHLCPAIGVWTGGKIDKSEQFNDFKLVQYIIQ